MLQKEMMKNGLSSMESRGVSFGKRHDGDSFLRNVVGLHGDGRDYRYSYVQCSV